MNKVKIAFYVAIILGAAYKIYKNVSAPSEDSQERRKLKEARPVEEITRRLFDERKETTIHGRDTHGGGFAIKFENSIIMSPSNGKRLVNEEQA